LFHKEFDIGPDQVASFAQLVQDANPVHLDPVFAASTRYKQPICHGMLCAGYISGCLVECFGQGTIYLEQQLSFRRPVPVGSRIRVVLSDPQPEGDRLRLTTLVELQVRTLWKKAIEGSALILPGNAGQEPATHGEEGS